MVDEQPGNDPQVTPQSAVEIDEEALDAAAGGLNNKNPDLLSLHVDTSPIDVTVQKVSPRSLLAGGPHVKGGVQAQDFHTKI